MRRSWSQNRFRKWIYEVTITAGKDLKRMEFIILLKDEDIDTAFSVLKHALSG